MKVLLHSTAEGRPPRGVARRSNTPGIFPPRALRGGRLGGLGAMLDFHHGLLAARSIGERSDPVQLFDRRCVLAGLR